MAVGNTEKQVQWSSSDSVSVSAAGNQTSDLAGLSATAIARAVTLKADNAGTPTSGDTVDIYLLATCGDPDGSGSDEYPNDDSDGDFLANLDTYAAPAGTAIATVVLPAGIKDAKLYAKNNAGSNSITVSACINEKTVS